MNGQLHRQCKQMFANRCLAIVKHYFFLINKVDKILKNKYFKNYKKKLKLAGQL